MSKLLTVITLAIVFVVGGLFSSNYSYAATEQNIDKIQQNRQNINQELTEAEKQVADLMSEIQRMTDEMERVKQSLEDKQDNIEKTEEKIKTTIKDISVLQDEIKVLEKDIQKRQEILKDRISSYQQAGGSMSFIEVIFGADSFSDFISRTNAVSKITESDAQLVENLEKDIHKVVEKQNLAMKKLEELNTMRAEQEKVLAQINKEKQQNEQQRQNLEAKKQELITLIDNLKIKDKKLASLETEVKQKLEAAKQQSQENEMKKVENETKVSAKKVNNSSEQSKEVSEPNQDQEKEKDTENKTFTVTATAYTIESAGGSGVTYTGIDLRENPNAKVIAVDPDVIPLGSVVHVEGYGYAIAGDIGGAIGGKKIDVYVPTRQAALEWGVRTVTVTIQ